MRFFEFKSADPIVVLRAFKTVALADGQLDASERALMVTAARCLGVDADPDAVEPIDPDELARAVPDEGDRRRVLQGAMLMSIADAEETKDEVAVLRRMREALGVEEGVFRSLERLAAGHR